MNKTTKPLGVRYTYMTIGIIAMLFAGVLYAWSILKAPLGAQFGWKPTELTLCFTIAMSFFCIGGLLGAKLSKRIGHKLTLLASGILSGLGFCLTATLDNVPVVALYVTYGTLSGLGVGIAYNVITATVSTWFPDKKGLCSGCLMMGFGASALVLGNVADAMFKSSVGWRATYVVIGLSMLVVITLSGLLLKKPSADTVLPMPKVKKSKKGEDFEVRDMTSREMLKRPSFRMIFVCISFLAAVGSSVISFAKDLALSVGSPEAVAVSLVGILAVFNGLGRILTGIVFDLIGRRKTMICSNILTIIAAGITLLAVTVGSLPLCVVGLCLAGISYGTCSTITSAFTMAFYGMKHFSSNMAFMTFNAMVASFIATLSSKVLEATGGYTATFAMLLCMTCISLVLNIIVKRP